MKRRWARTGEEKLLAGKVGRRRRRMASVFKVKSHPNNGLLLLPPRLDDDCIDLFCCCLCVFCHLLINLTRRPSSPPG